MKTKTLLTVLLFFAISFAKTQITYSITIPGEIPNYDGTYDNFGQGELYYPNGGEVRFTDIKENSAIDVAKYYTMNTHPKRYLMNNNNISLVYAKNDPASLLVGGAPDTLQRIDLEWLESNPGAFLARVDTQNFAQLNYFTQWFSSAGRTGVKGSAAIACQSIYRNIDLVYTSNNAGLVMYFIVYPGGSYNDIIMHVNGSTANSIVSNKLKLEANWDNTYLQKPQMYQYTLVGSVVTPVAVCNASWQSTGVDSYQISNSTSYNTSLPLIIQVKQGNPVSATTNGLCWSTYFGGTQSDYLTKTHTDALDNLYIAGSSNSLNQFPQLGGVNSQPNKNGDGVVSKLNPAGKLQWSTFIGGSSTEEIRDFEVSGNKIFCVGKTASSDLQTKIKSGATNDTTFGGPAWDGFISEFEYLPTFGNFQNNWLTYYGGNGDEELNACKFDASGNLFVVGESASTDLTPIGPSGSYQQNFNTAQLNPSTPLVTDAIIAKFNTSSLQTWLTYFGTDALGTNAHTHAADYFYDLAISGTNLYACGKTGGTNLPNSLNNKLVAGKFDGILAHFTTAGVLNNSKYTEGNISNYAVKERLGDVYTVGEANSTMNPVNSGLYFYDGTISGTSDACFSVHNLNLTSTIHSTFLGGDMDDGAYDIQFTSNNLFVVVGGTNSSDFLVTSLSSMYQVNAAGFNDNFVSCFQKNNTNIVWSTYLGSNFQESMQYPTYFNSGYPLVNTAISIDSQNRTRVLGSSNSYNTFPLEQGTNNPYFQPQGNGGTDATITCFDVADVTAIVGLKNFENTQFAFGFYPNPTTQNLSITNPSLIKEDLRFAIYDTSGKKLKEGNLKAGDAKNIDVSFLSKGIYIINVSNGVKTYSNKFVKTEY